MHIGANYWASHAGVYMWRDWRPDVMEKDFALLRSNKLQILRVFPLWPDFQPLEKLMTYHSKQVELRHGDAALPQDELIQDGMSEEMMARFGVMADLAAKHQLGLVVGLVTGWMSGRLFVPPALEGLNPITDPKSILWQVRMVRAMVRQFKNHPAIRAWDLGNECNVMGAASREESWLWTASIANAIRAEDTTRPIISGMHSLQVNPQEPWAIRDQGELVDLLTTHPYPPFTPHCNQEPVNTMRPLLHAVAETCLYADLSGRPAFVEEFGSLGPMICSEEVAADMVRVRLYDIWAHDCRAALWWCAHDQTELEQAPYDWHAVERELGLFRPDGSAKPMVAAFRQFAETLEAMPVKALPPRRVDAVCLLTSGQDNWATAYSSFVLARQAGFDLRFHYNDRQLPEADLYLLPCVKGHSALSRHREKELWEKVARGATLYLSFDDGAALGQFVGNSGITLKTRSKRRGPCRFLWRGQAMTVAAPEQFEFLTDKAEVLAAESDGTAVYVRSKYGKGTVYTLALPLETSLALEAQAFAPKTMAPYYEIYQAAAAGILATRQVRKTSPWLGLTEHATPEGELIVVLINYLPETLRDELTIAPGYRFSRALAGAPPQDGNRVELAANDAAVWVLSRVA